MSYLNEVVIFFFILIRVSAFMLTAPLFSAQIIPGQIKAGLILVITMALFPALSQTGLNLPGGLGGYLLAILSEAGVGIFMGLAANFIFSSILLAGQYMDLQMGFAMASMLDPANELNISLLSQFLYILALVTFINANGHLIFIAYLAQSYQLVPLSVTALKLQGLLFKGVALTFAGMFVLAVQMAIPLVALLLICELILGFLGRTAPQSNVFMLSFSLNIVVGLLALCVIVPELMNFFGHVFDVMDTNILNVLRGMS